MDLSAFDITTPDLTGVFDGQPLASDERAFLRVLDVPLDKSSTDTAADPIGLGIVGSEGVPMVSSASAGNQGSPSALWKNDILDWTHNDFDSGFSNGMTLNGATFQIDQQASVAAHGEDISAPPFVFNELTDFDLNGADVSGAFPLSVPGQPEGEFSLAGFDSELFNGIDWQAFDAAMESQNNTAAAAAAVGTARLASDSVSPFTLLAEGATVNTASHGNVSATFGMNTLTTPAQPNLPLEGNMSQIPATMTVPPTADMCFSPGRGWYSRPKPAQPTSSNWLLNAGYATSTKVATPANIPQKPKKGLTLGPASYLGTLQRKRPHEEASGESPFALQGTASPQTSSSVTPNTAANTDYTHPLQGVPAGQLRACIKQECSCHKHIKRPRNEFFIYRTWYKEQHPQRSMPKLSEEAAIAWKNESPQVRAHFRAQATAEKAEHARRYPDYHFKPKTQHEKEMIKFGEPSCTCGAYAYNMAQLQQPTATVHQAYQPQGEYGQTPMQPQRPAPQAGKYPLAERRVQLSEQPYYPLAVIPQAGQSATKRQRLA